MKHRNSLDDLMFIKGNESIVLSLEEEVILIDKIKNKRIEFKNVKKEVLIINNGFGKSSTSDKMDDSIST